MNGQIVGYKRVSSVDQNLSRQLDGIRIDKLFEDKASGKDTNRPGLTACLDYIREGDILLVHSIDRLARNLADLEKIVSSLNAKGITVHFHKESLIFAGDETPMSKLQLQMMGAFAEFERALMRERQREGIEAAKKQGRTGGRPNSLTKTQEALIKTRALSGENKKELAAEYGVCRQTIYNICSVK